MVPFIDLIAQLVKDAGSIRVVAEQAGLNVANIDLGGAPRTIWASVLQEESASGSDGAVLRVLMARYPEREDLFRSGFAYLSKRRRREPSLGQVVEGTDQIAGMVEHVLAELSGLTGRLDAIENRQSTLETMARTGSQFSPTRRMAWLLGYCIFAMPALLFFHEVRASLGMTWQVAVGATVVIWLASLFPFAYWLGVFEETR